MGGEGFVCSAFVEMISEPESNTHLSSGALQEEAHALVAAQCLSQASTEVPKRPESASSVHVWCLAAHIAEKKIKNCNDAGAMIPNYVPLMAWWVVASR